MIVYLNVPCGFRETDSSAAHSHPVDVPIACTVTEMLSFCRVRLEGAPRVTVNGAASPGDRPLMDGDVVEVSVP